MNDSTEELVSDLQKAIERIESRIEELRANQATSAKRLEDIIAIKADPVQVIKDLTDSVQKQNEAVWSQLSGRWDLVQGMLIVLTLAFTVIVGIGIWNASETRQVVKDITGEARDATRDARKSADETKALIDDTKLYSEVVGYVTEGDIRISQGYRELERKDFASARQFAADAIRNLTAAFEQTGISIEELTRSYVYNPKTCMFETTVGSSFAPCQRSGAGQLSRTEKLRPAICLALFAAHDLHAKTVFLADRNQGSASRQLRIAGEILTLLNRGRTEGYHWIGLAEAEDLHRDEAIACFELSVHQTLGSATKDYVNLAELEFVTGHYPDSQSSANAYLKSVTDPYQSPAGVVVQFYLSLAEFLTGTNLEAPQTFRDKFMSLKGIDVEGTFSSALLKPYLESPDSALLKRSPSEQSEVRLTASCLMTKTKTC